MMKLHLSFSANTLYYSIPFNNRKDIPGSPKFYGDGIGAAIDFQ
jgi:hypothetical protein